MENRGSIFDDAANTQTIEIDHIATRYFGTFKMPQEVKTFGSSFNNTLYVTIPFQIIADNNPQHFSMTITISSSL
jgi:hypothetical protein